MDTNLFETAEAPGFHVIPRHPDVVITPGWTFLPLQPKTAAVQRIRLAPDELEVAREAVRELGRQGGFEAIGWWITRLSEPADIPERLGLEHLETLTAL